MKTMTAEPDGNLRPDGDLRIVGKPLPRVDAVAKLTGATAYADDIELPGTLYVKILRSHHPHARVLSVDTSSASSMTGVAAVITGQDLPTKYGIMPTSQDERALEHEKVRYVGDPVAAVAAVAAEKAGKSVSVCGEMAGDPYLTRLLLGMGLRNYSMQPASLLTVKQKILKSNSVEAASLVSKILKSAEPDKVQSLLARLNA